MQKKIKRILNKISIMMGIDMPKIIFNSDNSFYTDGVIHLKMYDDFNKTLFLALHELRHHYQLLYLKRIKDSISKIIEDEMKNEKEYRKSYLECDAYTFSLYVFENILHISYSPGIEVKKMILNFQKKYSFVFTIFI